MLQKQTFEKNLYMKLFRWAYILLISNLCLVLVTAPFFLAVCLLAVDPRNLPLFLISLLPFGSGVPALLAVVDRFKEEKDVEPVRCFFQAYRKFWLKGQLFWLAGWLGSIVAVTDMVFFAKLSNGQWLIPFFLLLGVLSVALSLNCWYFLIRNPEAAAKDVLRMAAYYTLRKWYSGLLNVLLFAALLALMLLKPQFGFTLTPALFVGLIYLNSGKLHPKEVVA